MTHGSGRWRSLIVLFAGVALVAAACGDDDADPSGGDAAPNGVDDGDADGQEPSNGAAATVPQAEPSPREDDLPSGLAAVTRDATLDGLPDPIVPLDEIRRGGPPPDGIPPIDEPRFLRADDVGFVVDNEPVLAIEIDGDARAYPIQIMTWHEIVNDTIAGVPVTISYCPLCNTAVAYDRRLDDRVLDFGTSGMLWNSALVMYDRQTETLWSHVTAEGVVGALTGESLDTYPVATVPWSTWRDANPDGLVLSRDTGFDRDYGRNPYPGYDDVTSQPFLFEGEVDGRFTAMTRIVGIEREGQAVAVPLAELESVRVIEVELDGEELVVWWEPGTASALDTVQIAEGGDVGATGVFLPVHDGQRLTFEPGDDGFTDDQTDSTWNLLGRAIDGPLRGAQLEPVERVDTFWFAWSAFQPDTEIVAAQTETDVDDVDPEVEVDE